jgi:hypothetical protein
MSRLNGSYHGKFTEDYTDYDIDYFSRMEGMDDNFNYMSKVDKKTLHRRQLRLHEQGGSSTTPSTTTSVHGHIKILETIT